MHNAISATILGTTAAVFSTIAFVPQIKKTWKTGGEDLSYFMLSLYVAGVTLWLCYGLVIGATALSLANAASILFAGTCLLLKLIKDKRRAVRAGSKRLRIAIDMDETIADSLTEHIRRYNAEFAEKITGDDLYGKHLEEFASSDRSHTVRRMIRDELFFDCLGVIAEAQQVV
jgi:MtN3 and saliva related transmembrane protein